MATNSFDPSKYGATPFDPVSQGAVPAGPDPAQQTMTQKGADFMRGSAMGAGPDLIGGLQAASTPAANAILTLLGSNKRATPVDNEFFTPEQEAEWRDPMQAAKNVGADLAGAASYTQLPQIATAGLASKIPYLVRPGLMPLLANLGIRGGIRGELYGASQKDPFNPAYPAGGAFAEALWGLLSKGLTIGQVGKSMEKVADKSTKQGHADSLRDIETEARQIMKEKMGPDYTLHKKEADMTLHTLINDKGHTAIDPTQLTPSQMLEWKRSLSPKAQGNFVQQLLSAVRKPDAGIENQVAEALRSTLSSRITDIAPEMGALNTLYGLYKNPWLGSPAMLTGKIAAATSGLPLLKYLLGSLR